MRACIVSQEYPPGYVGGIGTQSRVKALGLAALGHEVEVLTAGDEDGPPLVSWDDGGVRVHEVRTPGGDFPVYRTETYWLGHTWAVLGAVRSLAQQRPFDVIDFPDYGAEGFAFQLDRQDDDPTAVVVHLHGSLRMFAEQIGWPQPAERLFEVGTLMEDVAIHSADRLLAASRSIADFTTGHAGINPELIDVVDGAVDTTTFYPGPPRVPARDRAELLFVGSISANKGVRTVFDAFVELAPAFPQLKLTIAGSGDEEICEQMRALADAAALSDRLRLLGFVEHADLPDLYRDADIVAAPSQFEGGLGMVYLEAMASGVPVVASAAGGAADAVADGETGYLLARGDTAETKLAIRTLLEDPRLRHAMGDAGRRRAEQRFAPPQYAARVVEGYERAIRHRRDALVTW